VLVLLSGATFVTPRRLLFGSKGRVRSCESRFSLLNLGGKFHELNLPQRGKRITGQAFLTVGGVVKGKGWQAQKDKDQELGRNKAT